MMMILTMLMRSIAYTLIDDENDFGLDSKSLDLIRHGFYFYPLRDPGACA